MVAWPQGKKVTLTSEIGSSQMQVRIRKQQEWFGLNGELRIDEDQALALAVQRAPAGPTLVLAPTSVCSNWIEAGLRFAPTLNPQRFGDGDWQQMLDAAGPIELHGEDQASDRAHRMGQTRPVTIYRLIIKSRRPRPKN